MSLNEFVGSDAETVQVPPGEALVRSICFNEKFRPLLSRLRVSNQPEEEVVNTLVREFYLWKFSDNKVSLITPDSSDVLNGLKKYVEVEKPNRTIEEIRSDVHLLVKPLLLMTRHEKSLRTGDFVFQIAADYILEDLDLALFSDRSRDYGVSTSAGREAVTEGYKKVKRVASSVVDLDVNMYYRKFLFGFVKMTVDESLARRGVASRNIDSLVTVMDVIDAFRDEPKTEEQSIILSLPFLLFCTGLKLDEMETLSIQQEIIQKLK